MTASISSPTGRAITRRRFGEGLALACMLPSGLALAQAKSLKLIVPYPAGGTADILPRILAEKMRAPYPGGVLVDNRPGAGGNIGAEAVFRSPPDGTVLLASPPGPIAINQFLYPKIAFDANQWVPVTVMATVPNVLTVSPRLPVNSVQELIAYAKANPDKVTFASQGNGTTSHLTASLFMTLTKTSMVHVPYKGTAPALVDIMGNQVDIFFDNIASSAVQHNAGKLRVLAVADEQRSAALPNVPTFAEAGLQGMTAVTFFAVMAPPGTPPALASEIQKHIAAALQDADVQRKFAEQGAMPRGWTTERTAQFVASEREKWGKVVTMANVKVE
jgi:tripartite-type tricarboxylate transporter receptor subunit TctC